MPQRNDLLDLFGIGRSAGDHVEELARDRIDAVDEAEGMHVRIREDEAAPVEVCNEVDEPFQHGGSSR